MFTLHLSRFLLSLLPMVAHHSQLTIVLAFSGSSSSSFSSQVVLNDDISKVSTNTDIISLAKLRYQEFILDGISDDSPPPTLSNFCRATAEIYEERKLDGSIVFLYSTKTKKNEDGDVEVVVGAAELSPIELQGCVDISRSDTNDNDNDPNSINAAMYITDVVTSSKHRRLGIGLRLMHEVERIAWKEMGTRIVFLHVKYDNIGARKFYERLGYITIKGEEDCCVESEDNQIAVSNDGIISISLEDDGPEHLLTSTEKQNFAHTMTINAKQLESNAGATGQILMMKQLSNELTSKETIGSTLLISMDQSSSMESSPSKVKEGIGFGSQKEVVNKPPRKKKRNRK